MTMPAFPAFVRSPANRIAASSQFTDDVEGYVFDGADGSQVALWTARAILLGSERIELRAGQGRFVDSDGPLHWRHQVSFSGHNIMNMGIWYEAMMRWLGPARRVMAMSKVAVARRRDGAGAWHDVKVPDHLDILATFKREAVAHMQFSAVAGFAPPAGVWIYGTEGTLRLEADAKRLWGGKRGDKELREIPIPAARRVGWRVEEEFVNAIRGREKITRTGFEDGVRYMEFTDAVTRSTVEGKAVDVTEL